jgi:alkanesulfonate monooxygenase SsuD/methylene tetrahydromethanopterin reductase-like flavin-dependent oxidoreductase (luciferase family)
MHIGIQAAQIGRWAGPDTIRASALAAEQIGYSSIWVHDRFTGPGPELPGRALDPFVVLAAIASTTARIRLGTSVLAAPWYPVGVLARSLASLDVVSRGRLTVGLGLGHQPWAVRGQGNAPEHHRSDARSAHARSADAPSADRAGDARGSDRRGREARLDHVLDRLDTLWPAPGDGAPGRGLVASSGAPTGRPSRPPVLLAGSTSAALDRVARRADGWNPVNWPLDRLAPTWGRIRDQAATKGRDPDALRLVVRADVTLEPRALDGDRPVYAGSLDQVVDDLVATRAVGTDEVILGLPGASGLDEMLDGYARLADAVGMPKP